VRIQVTVSPSQAKVQARGSEWLKALISELKKPRRKILGGKNCLYHFGPGNHIEPFLKNSLIPGRKYKAGKDKLVASIWLFGP